MQTEAHQKAAAPQGPQERSRPCLLACSTQLLQYTKGWSKINGATRWPQWRLAHPSPHTHPQCHPPASLLLAAAAAALVHLRPLPPVPRTSTGTCTHTHKHTSKKHVSLLVASPWSAHQLCLRRRSPTALVPHAGDTPLPQCPDTPLQTHADWTCLTHTSARCVEQRPPTDKTQIITPAVKNFNLFPPQGNSPDLCHTPRPPNTPLNTGFAAPHTIP